MSLFIKNKIISSTPRQAMQKNATMHKCYFSSCYNKKKKSISRIYFFLLLFKPGCPTWFPRPEHNDSESSSPGADPLKPVMLFDVQKDPEERNEVSAQFPAIVDYLLNRLQFHLKNSLPINFPDDDPRCDPGPSGAWGPWA